MKEFNIGNIYLVQNKTNRKPDDHPYTYREDYFIEYHTKLENSVCTYIIDLGRISVGIDVDNGKSLYCPEFEPCEYAVFTLSDKDFLDFKQVMLEFYKYFDYDTSELKLYE